MRFIFSFNVLRRLTIQILIKSETFPCFVKQKSPLYVRERSAHKGLELSKWTFRDSPQVLRSSSALSPGSTLGDKVARLKNRHLWLLLIENSNLGGLLPDVIVT
ncbi:unnamed protein product [Kuraishia capsulata CBS 1993]|uniref:Uncharacterized protein n=1 Tax=Kuraishia capsulata CBS 1993 TaxID=1382522 RepID=W6MRC8_9ASCO|nr:uncharacterized protein KUCA_T00005252001 [Kuraishia capsulata CBS 1993]CDK29264.1 unnamed protein product [Kuraishia capsulata CBS 1993]